MVPFIQETFISSYGFAQIPKAIANRKKEKSKLFQVKEIKQCQHTQTSEKSTEINKNRNRHSYIAGGSMRLFSFHWETLLTIPVKFTKTYILFPIT